MRALNNVLWAVGIVGLLPALVWHLWFVQRVYCYAGATALATVCAWICAFKQESRKRG